MTTQSFQFAATLALSTIERHLIYLNEARSHDKEWAETDNNVDSALDLIRKHLSLMKKRVYDRFETDGDDEIAMDSDWYMMAGTSECAMKCFSRPDAYFGHCLKGLFNALESLPELLYAAECTEFPKLEGEVKRSQLKAKKTGVAA